MSADPCVNCGRPDANLVSFDLDLPDLRLCFICSVAIVSDPELFDDLGTRRRTP